jgi:hypothetical protein
VVSGILALTSCKALYKRNYLGVGCSPETAINKESQ